MRPKPLYCSLTFWSGILMTGFVVWAYFYSLFLCHSTELMISNPKGDSFHAVLAYGRICFSAEESQLIRSPPREWRVGNDRFSDLVGLFSTFGKDLRSSSRRNLQIPLLLPWMGSAAIWFGLLHWRARRTRRASTLQASTPPAN